MQMVNDGFPDQAAYGFEMVDARPARHFAAKTPINRKFTANRNSWAFHEFSPN